MTWWDSIETLSKLQTALAIFVSVVGLVTLTIKLRADQLKKQADTRRTEERTRLDKQLEDKTVEARELARQAQLAGLPRSLTPEQRAKLIAAASTAPKGKIIVKANMLDSEAEVYANEIQEALASAGYELVELGHTGIVSLHKQGGAILVMDQSKLPQHALPLQACFLQAGIEIQVGQSKSAVFSDDAVIVWISRK